MPTIAYANPDQAATPPVPNDRPQQQTDPAGFSRALAHNPRLFGAFAALSAAAEQTTLDPKLRELAYLAVSAVNGCTYGAYHHRRTGAAVGLTPRQIEEVSRFAASDAFDDLQKHVIRYAVQVARDVRPSKTLVATLKERLSDAEMMELTFTIGLASLTNRFNLAHGTELP
ncbi:MAG TPA: carboxymuconolactone decarboxylase family protein [Armatimonadaceae bacterium]|nr:carboxymuconolactone decarboxylase family protein [Armatimonadaceae bacterium]